MILAPLVARSATIAEDFVPALVQAVAELSSERKVLDLPEGAYTIASMWTITREGLTIRGAGIGKTVLRCDPKFTNIMVHIKGANTTITNLTLDGNGTTPGGRKVEVLYRDSAASDSSASKRLTEELIVKDHVSLIGGLTLTPDAASTAPVINEAKIPAFIFNAATPTLINMSPYFLRVGQNITQPAELGAVYARQLGKTRGYTAVADFAPGHVVEEAFTRKFIAEGGQMVGKDRIPLNTVDFAAFAERVANANPDVLEIFIPPGAPVP